MKCRITILELELFFSQQAKVDGVQTTFAQHEITEPVELQNTPLSPREKVRLHFSADWELLAGLMGVSSAERDDIRNSTSYHDNRAKAEKILWIINCRESFSRKDLADFLKEIKKEEWVEPILTGKLRSL